MDRTKTVAIVLMVAGVLWLAYGGMLAVGRLIRSAGFKRG